MQDAGEVASIWKACLRNNNEERQKTTQVLTAEGTVLNRQLSNQYLTEAIAECIP